MHSAAMSASRLTIGWSQVRKQTASPRFVRLSELRKLKDCEQVAAACYRVLSGDIEFLLVKTRKGRWIFPKGNAEPGLTHAQAAALEAFEEAGVHGRMEEAPFTRYMRRRRSEARNTSARSGEKELAIHVYLCEVLRLVPPQESDRTPTWFCAAKAKRRLQERRTPDFGTELARVVDRAVSQIQRSRRKNRVAGRVPPGGSQRVQFIDIGTVRETAGRAKTPRAGTGWTRTPWTG
jgi:8-oxo-dGTP pyrophosphatase MutT (NUDIX family)